MLIALKSTVSRLFLHVNEEIMSVLCTSRWWPETSVPLSCFQGSVPGSSGVSLLAASVQVQQITGDTEEWHHQGGHHEHDRSHESKHLAAMHGQHRDRNPFSQLSPTALPNTAPV